jgi:hypothetical protein
MDGELVLNTKRLIDFLERGKDQFEQSKSSGHEGDFFLEVKPFADMVKETLDVWVIIAKKWIQSERPPFINETQLDTTYDHIEKISIQSFYPKTSRKIFISSFQSSQYVLQSILQYHEHSHS